jgi:hypothetical protein
LGFQFHIGGHAREDTAGGIIDANLYANDLVYALFAGLNIARQEFGLLVDRERYVNRILRREALECSIS